MQFNHTCHLRWFASVVLLSAFNLQISTGFAQGTAFSYQGRLTDNSGPATGLYDMRFSVWDAATNGTRLAGLTNSAVAVSGGYFTVTLDFGPGVFTGPDRWLNISVCTNGSTAGYTGLSPRQQLTPAPYAIQAGSASNLLGSLPAAQLSGTVSNSSLPGSPSFSGTVAAASFSGDGANVTNVNALTLGGLGSGSFWQVGGNNVAEGQFLGSTNNQPLILAVNGTPGWRILPTVNDAYHSNIINIVGGSSLNYMAPDVYGSVIAGGGMGGFFGNLYSNSVAANWSFLGGGANNSIQSNSYSSVLVGGSFNSIQANAYYAVLSGGHGNSIQTSASASALVGGYANTIGTNAYYSFLGGGAYNTIGTNASSSFLGGGVGNTIGTNAYSSVLGGGNSNMIQSNAYNSFLGGGGYNRIGTNADTSVLVGGGGNSIQSDAVSSALLGGGGNSVQSNASYSFLGGGLFNVIGVYANESVLAGGSGNTIGTNASHSFLGGGDANGIGMGAMESVLVGGGRNSIGSDAGNTFLGGGYNNSIQASANNSILVGGYGNTIGTNAYDSFLGGGTFNNIGLNAVYSFLGGGGYNTNNASYSVVPGGYGNLAWGNYTFAAGHQAKAVHTGAFVWADSQNADYASTGNDQFDIRAAGGVYVQSDRGVALNAADMPIITRGWDPFDSSAPAQKQGLGRWGLFMEPFNLVLGIPGDDVFWPPRNLQVRKYAKDGTSVTLMTVDQGGNLTAIGNVCAYNGVSCVSDRAEKERFAAVDVEELLEKVVALPITTWDYKRDPNVRHMGPVAQDFSAAFGLGSDDKHITTVDADGVALAAIQGLNQKLEQKETEITELKARLERLERLLQEKQEDQE